MKCPKCNGESHCPCESCQELSPHLQPKSISLNMSEDRNDWDEMCPFCGFTQSVHLWFELSLKQYDEWEQSQAQEHVE